MITTQEVVSTVLSRLDAEGSDRYLFDQDIKPAINSSIKWLMAVFNSAFSEKKLTEENLRDLNLTRVWQTNAFSRFEIKDTDLGHKLWSILAIYPEIEFYPTSSTIDAVTNEYDSKFRPDVTFLDSIHSAGRITSEEWNENKQNVFMAGNAVLINGLKSYGYKNFTNYSSDQYITGAEIQIRPDVPSQFVAVNYLKVPTNVDQITDSIEYPETIFDILVEKTLNFISYKQGDQTNLYSVTERDVARLVQLLV